MSCPALAAFDWPDYRDDVFEPVNGWERWHHAMTRQRVFAPTLQTIANAVSMGTPWMPVPQEDAADAAGQSPRGRLPVAWENSFEARPSRDSRSVARRTNECRDHRLIAPMLQTASGEAATAGANLQVNFDFSTVSGPKATLITEGAINLDQPN
eukprot:791670-Pyramimonas_sp.AAC.1